MRAGKFSAREVAEGSPEPRKMRALAAKQSRRSMKAARELTPNSARA